MNRIVPLISAAVLAVAGVALPETADETTPPAELVQVATPLPSPVPTVVAAVAVVDEGAEAELRTDDDAAASLEATRVALDRTIRTIADRLQAATPGTAEVDAIDTDLVAVIEQEQAALGDALDRLDWTAGADDFDLMWRTVDVHGKAMKRLVRLRLKARDSISEERRHGLLGLGREGLQQAAREARTASLLVRYQFVSRRHSIDEVPQQARDLFTVGEALTRLLLVVSVLAAALFVRRRWRGWLEGLRTSTFRSRASVASKRRTQRLFKWAATVAPWGLFLITISALRWALGPAAETIEVNVLLTLLTVFGLYHLAIDVLATLLVNIAVHYGLDATDERRAMLLRSVRMVLRVATILVLISLMSRGMGQGFLATVVMKFAWLVVLAAVLVELFRWRGVMIDTFLKLQPKGRLSATLRAKRANWQGAFLAPAAFVWLAGRGVATVTREFALGFEQTQRALAFLFRQRVQRQAELSGYAAGAVAELPDGLVEAFREESVESGPLVVPNFPGLNELHEILTSWRDSGARGSYLLTGERGVGKTTWLNQVRRDDLDIHRILLGRRVTDPADLCARLAELLEVDAGPDAGPRELGRALFNGPKRVVVLDMSQHLFLTTVGGYEAFKAFATLVNRTCNNVFWLCSMSAYAWRHLRAVRPDATVFRTRHHLTGWTEEQISELIRTRCAASGVRFNFADLVVDRLEGVAVGSSLIESADGYSRLLWDYSDGNPRAALHFFLRSLDPDRNGTVRVRLFKAPDVALLEDAGQDGLFVLAAIITHESISLDDLVEVTRFDRAQTFIHLDRLLEVGAINLEHGMYRVSTTWHRAGVRLLRRRNLLPA
jgi:hypothetical protein